MRVGRTRIVQNPRLSARPGPGARSLSSIAACSASTPAQVAAHYAPEGSLAINDGSRAVARAAVTDVARSFYAALPDMQVPMRELVTDGNHLEYQGPLDHSCPYAATQWRRPSLRDIATSLLVR